MALDQCQRRIRQHRPRRRALIPREFGRQKRLHRPRLGDGPGNRFDPRTLKRVIQIMLAAAGLRSQRDTKVKTGTRPGGSVYIPIRARRHMLRHSLAKRLSGRTVGSIPIGREDHRTTARDRSVPEARYAEHRPGLVSGRKPRRQRALRTFRDNKSLTQKFFRHNSTLRGAVS